MQLIYLILLDENRTAKPLQIILSKGKGLREKNDGDEPNQSTL
jgi:hypothetical protein